MMGSNQSWNSIIFLILSLNSFALVHSYEKFASESLDTLLQNLTLKELLQHRSHTGALHKAALPDNLSGMKVSIVRLRSRTLWRRGANFSNFFIPSRSLPVPHVRRVVLVYQDLGNWSSLYYNVPGYFLATSVVGFKAFDASNLSSKSVTKLNINTVGKFISIHFPNFTIPKDIIPRTACATFNPNGTVFFSEISLPNVCLSTSDGHFGHFAIVAPLNLKGKRRVWRLWVIGFVVGLFGLVVLSIVGRALLKILKAKKIHEMERQADEDVILDTIWIGSVKMPSATFIRTHPVLESGSLT